VHHVQALQALQCHLWPSAGPRAWYVKLDSSMRSMGYMPTCSIWTVCKKGKMIALFYVDDALLAAPSKEMRAKANRDISRDRTVCAPTITPDTHSEELLERFGMQGANLRRTQWQLASCCYVWKVNQRCLIGTAMLSLGKASCI
jgi:hypothetical protein